MKDILTDGKLQLMAAVALLEQSRLVEWIPEENRFVPVLREAFESSWRINIDPVFGRLLCWIVFSAGAEFLAKGTCLVNGVEIRSERKVPAYPTEDIEDWAPKFLKAPNCNGMVMVTHFGTLGDLTYNNPEKKVHAALSRLCSTVNATAMEKALLFAAYNLLAKSIRNRDAHAYVANVRDSHFSLVPELFTRCFNILVSWLPGGPSKLTQWRAEAKEFISLM
ncbi:MAG: hypothetical protein AB1467_07120 [Candidatus Diapherotrites archaeon]